MKKSKSTSFPGALKSYLEWRGENRKDNRTARHLSVALKRAFGKKLLTDINPFMIEKYKMNRIKQVSRLTGQPISRSTVNQELSLFNQLFEKSLEWGLHTGQNPMDKVKRFKIPKRKKPGYLLAGEVEAIRNQMRCKIQQDIVTFCYAVGWRINEIIGLRWEDIDLERGIAWIIDPKNSNTVEVELSDEAIEAVKRQEHKQSFSEYVFSKTDGTQFKSIHQGFKNAAKRAGIELPPGKAWHILRASWTTEMHKAGASVEDIRQLGNWSDSSMVLYYLQGSRSEEKRSFLNRLPKLDCKKTAKKEKVVRLKSHG